LAHFFHLFIFFLLPNFYHLLAYFLYQEWSS
jgi:hypothetical protein